MRHHPHSECGHGHLLLLLGFLFLDVARAQSCSGTFASSSCAAKAVLSLPAGNLTSNSPGMYKAYQDCEFLITATSGNVVTLIVDSLSTECGYDYLFIHDGNTDTAPLIAALSGDPTSLPPFYSSGQQMLIEFISDANIEQYGFRAHYFTSACPNDCSGAGTCVGGSCVCSTGHDGLACEHQANTVPSTFCWSNSSSLCACNYDLPWDYTIYTKNMGTYESGQQLSNAPEYFVRCPSLPVVGSGCPGCDSSSNPATYARRQCPDPALSCNPRCGQDGGGCWAALGCCLCQDCDTNVLYGGTFTPVLLAIIGATVACLLTVVVYVVCKRRRQLPSPHDGNPPVIVQPRDVLLVRVVSKIPQTKEWDTFPYRPMDLPGVVWRCTVLRLAGEGPEAIENTTGAYAVGAILEADDEHGQRAIEAPTTDTSHEEGDSTSGVQYDHGPNNNNNNNTDSGAGDEGDVRVRRTAHGGPREVMSVDNELTAPPLALRPRALGRLPSTTFGEDDESSPHTPPTQRSITLSVHTTNSGGTTTNTTSSSIRSPQETSLSPRSPTSSSPSGRAGIRSTSLQSTSLHESMPAPGPRGSRNSSRTSSGVARLDLASISHAADASPEGRSRRDASGTGRTVASARTRRTARVGPQQADDTDDAPRAAARLGRPRVNNFVDETR